MNFKPFIFIIVITVIFLAGIIPMVMGIIYYSRENRRLDREEKEAQKAASGQ